MSKPELPKPILSAGLTARQRVHLYTAWLVEAIDKGYSQDITDEIEWLVSILDAHAASAIAKHDFEKHGIGNLFKSEITDAKQPH